MTPPYDLGMTNPTTGTETRTRRRVVVDQRELAKSIGSRIRLARQAAKLTQQELAGDRYTKAYISALELGHAKPSMAALDYLAPRLGTTPDRLMADQVGRWSRIDADLHLAAGRFAEAAEAYADLAERAVDPVTRGELLLGAGESWAKHRHPVESGAALAEASQLLATGGRLADRVRCQYWQAYVHSALGDSDEARRVLLDLLGRPEALTVEPDLEVRIRISLANIETEHGSPERAVLYLEEARGSLDTLDLRKRAIFFDTMATARYESGDAEAAISAALEARSLYRAAERSADASGIDNRLAMALTRMGNLTRADELTDQVVRTLEQEGNPAMLGHALATRATIRLAQGDPAGALEAADRSLALEAEHGPVHEQLGARVERARALGLLGRLDEADAAWADAGDAARGQPSPLRRKKVFAAWAEALADQGRHADAYEVMRQAL